MNFTEIKKLFSFGDVKTFKGGIHPDDMKESTNKNEIIDLEAPETLVFPLSQHIGAPASACVNVGDRVLMGQKIAEAGGFVSANIHSSVSGTVKAIENRLHPNGAMVNSIVIENDGLDELHESVKERKNIEKLSAKEIVEIVKEAGIVGMGGATFPTHVKFSPPADKNIEYVIINGAECEPYLTSDHRAMLETTDEVILGLKLIMKVFDLKEGYIAVETNKPDAIAALEEYAAKETDVKINIVKVKTKYPQGSEKQVIDAVTKRRVPPGKLPMDVGAVVNNIDTCAAVARAVKYGMPVVKRIVTVGGDCVSNPTNFRVRVGTPVSYVLEKTGEFIKQPEKLIMGGPMMGMALSTDEVPIIKGSSGILTFSEELVVKEETEVCLRCGKCVKACPMNLMPLMLREAARQGDLDRMEKLNVMDCIACGTCSYMCPAGQNPLQHIRTAKAKLMARKQEVKK